MQESFTVSRDFHTVRCRRGARSLRGGRAPKVPRGRVPRIAKLMALAIHIDNLIREGVVRNQAEVAELCHVTDARMAQIMSLRNLAPDIQEELLLLPRVQRGRDPIRETDVRQIAAQLDWRRQRPMWKALRGEVKNAALPPVEEVAHR